MLPEETLLALFPEGRTLRLGRFRKIRLHAPTLAHASAMESIGFGMLDKKMGLGDSIIAAWLLTFRADEVWEAASDALSGVQKFAKRLKGHYRQVAWVVNDMFDKALLTFVPPKEDEKTVNNDDLGHGYGWPLEIAEVLCSNYGWTFEHALSTEVQRALALVSIARERNGIKSGGPDYFDRLRLKMWKDLGIIDAKPKKGKGK